VLLTTRLWAFSVGMGPLLPLLSQFFTPDFMQQYVLMSVAASGPYFFAFGHRTQSATYW
jgi:hypothetical protein